MQRLLRRFHQALLWSQASSAYVLLFLFALLPFAIAPAIGTWDGFVDPEARLRCTSGEWKGLERAWNWWIWPVVLPLSLWLLRHSAREMLGLHAAIREVVRPSDRVLSTRRLNEAGQDTRLTAGVLLLMLFIMIAEFWNVGAAYLFGTCPKETDWTVFFLAEPHTGVSLPENLLHVVPAYLSQYAAGYMGILTFVLFFRHNWLYLRWIYQRHRHARATPRIDLDFDDELDCCFGQQKMRRAFNLQIWVLLATGLAIVVSRAVNVTSPSTLKLLEEGAKSAEKGVGAGFLFVMLRSVTDVDWVAVYPDGGQIVLVAMFLLVFMFVSMPSLVKFLPFRAGNLREGGAEKYIAEFIPPGHQNDPSGMDGEELGTLAAKFRANSFWPAGDNVAQRLFAFVFAVLLFVLLPVPAWKASATLVYVLLLVVLAAALTAAAFFAYRYVLGYVATVLVKDPKK